MTQNNAYSYDAGDSSSNKTVESEEDDVVCSTVRPQYESNLDGSRLNASNLIPPSVPDKPSISHIQSVTLQNSTDITFGNKTLYNGPITVNQYGLDAFSFGILVFDSLNNYIARCVLTYSIIQ